MSSGDALHRSTFVADCGAVPTVLAGAAGGAAVLDANDVAAAAVAVTGAPEPAAPLYELDDFGMHPLPLIPELLVPISVPT